MSVTTVDKKEAEYKNLSELDWLISEGVSIIPLKPDGSKEPLIKWKVFQDRKPTPEEITRWKAQTNNFAVVCGKVSGNLTIIDIDNEDLFEKLCLGEVAAHTKTDRTPHGYHIWLRTKTERNNKDLTFEGKKEIEFKSRNTVVTIAGSANEDGKRYERFLTSPQEIATVPDGFFADLENIYNDHRQTGKKGFGTLPKGVKLKGGGILKIINIFAGELNELVDHGNLLKCRCPFPKHEDKHPSFAIFPATNSFYCFGCKKGGNVINFVSEFLKISIKKAREKLREQGWIEERTTPKEEKSILTVDEIKSLEDDNGKGIIANYVIYKKVFDGRPMRFTVKVHLEDGKIKEEVEPELHSIPEQTSPTVNFCDAGCDSPKEIYNELKGIHQDYVAFGTDSIYPMLTALGSMVSYFREAYYTYAYFDFISGEPETGKTTAMKTLVFTSFYGTVASSVSEALLFREIDSSHCFYGLDNIERLFARPQDYAGIIDWLLSSYSRDIPCKRLAKVGDNFEVVSFDGYGEKAFTHITDFPVSLSTLKSRCIQIVMQKGRPTKFYPTPDKFAGIRDKMYHARLREYQKVKEIYEALIISNVLKGRTGDLYYPLLSIAKLISEDVYEKVLKYAKETERERTEVDEWSRELINLLYDEGIYGSISPKNIKSQYQDRLRDAGLLKEEKDIYTRTVTNKLKKLGFKRDNKKTENKTWFLIDKRTVWERAYEYDVIDALQKANFVNLLNLEEGQKTLNEEEAEEDSIDETTSGENVPTENKEEKKLTKLDKLANTGVLSKEKLTPIEINKIILEVGKCKECSKEEIDLIYVVHYSNGELKSVCADCGKQTMHDYDIKLSGGGSEQ